MAGKVVGVELSRDKEGKSRGFAVVVYDHPVEAVQSISMFNDQQLLDRRITVRFDKVAEEEQPRSLKRLPEGLRGVGMGLGQDGVPLWDVRATLGESMNQGNTLGLGSLATSMVQQQQPAMAAANTTAAIQAALSTILGIAGSAQQQQQQQQMAMGMGQGMMGGGMSGGMGGGMMGNGGNGMMGTGSGGMGGGMGGSRMSMERQMDMERSMLLERNMERMSGGGGMERGMGRGGDMGDRDMGMGGLSMDRGGGMMGGMDRGGMDRGGMGNYMDRGMSADGMGDLGMGGMGDRGMSSMGDRNIVERGMGGMSERGMGGMGDRGMGVGGERGMGVGASMMDRGGLDLGMSSRLGGVVGSGGMKRLSDKIIVKNLPVDCTWQGLKDRFGHAGEIKFAEIKERGVGVIR